MSPTKSKDGRMQKVETFLSTNELSETLEYAKFYLQKSKGEIMREALEDYLKQHFPKKIRNKVKDILKTRK